jgi:outer membrane protein assembly factor BamD (BamD/ComL family)
MHAESFAKQSPKTNLDQTETYKAIDAYQVFVNQYPETSRMEYCNNKIDELRFKLESKALKAAQLYYKTENFRAAAFSYKNLLIDYPDIDDSEEIQYKIVNSFYKYAEQSIASKQQERYEEAIKFANTFLSRYKESEFTESIQNTIQNSHYQAIKGAYLTALITNLDNRERKLKEVFDVFEVHHELITNEKILTDAEEIHEQAHFELVRTHFLKAQNAELGKSKNLYVKTLEEYSDFVNSYRDGKYNKEALKIYNAAQKNIKKLSNG